MRNGVVNIRDRLRRRSSISLDNPVSRSEEEAPVIKKETLRTTSLNGSTRRTLRNEVTRDLEKFSQRQHFATDFADDDKYVSDDDTHLGKRKKFYIVSDGETAKELYRTDMLHRIKLEEDSDASSDDETAFVRMSDRWREEWNHGVQVPLYKKLPDFIVRDAPCSSSGIPRPRSNGSSRRYVYPEFCGASNRLNGSAHNRRYIGSKHKHVIMPKLRHYQADRADRLYLSKLNKERAEVGLPHISEKTFGAVMDKLEICCHQAIHNDLLSPLSSPVASMDAEYDENACCDICRQPDYEDDDKIIFCDGCNLSVHQSCYGLDSVPTDEWLCQKCINLGFNALPVCVLCPLTGGAMKCTVDEEAWAHIACALWIREVRFMDIVHREPISNICDIPYERWMLRCSVCDTKLGACIQCSIETCTNAFHVCCALRNGQVMRIEHEGDEDDEDDGVRMVSLCKQHSLELHPSPMKFSSLDVPHRAALTLREMERVFFLYVGVEDVASILSFSEDVVSDIYEYWKLRRIDNGCKPLMSDKAEAERQIALRLKPISSAALPVRLRNETTMRQNLEKVRNLCYMVEKREKTKLATLKCWMETFTYVFEMLTEKNVPYSNRALERFIRAASSMQQPSSSDSSVSAITSAESSPGPSSSKSYSSARSPSPPRKLPVREMNGPSHNLRKYSMQRVPAVADKFVSNSEESYTSGHYSLRGLV